MMSDRPASYGNQQSADGRTAALQAAFGPERWGAFAQRLQQEGVPLEALGLWPRTDVAEAVAAALPGVGVFARQRLVSEIEAYFAAARANPLADVAASGHQQAPSAPSTPHLLFDRCLVVDDGGVHAKMATELQRLHTDGACALLAVEAVEWDDTMLSDILSRCAPSFLRELQRVVRIQPGGGSAELQRVAAVIANSDVVHTAELREEWRHRAAYLRGGQPTGASDLVPIYCNGTGLVTRLLSRGAQRGLDGLEATHHRLPPSPAFTKAVADARAKNSMEPLHPTLQTFDGFREAFDDFTFNIFQNISWEGIVVAGGSVLSTLRNPSWLSAFPHVNYRDHVRASIVTTLPRTLPVELRYLISEYCVMDKPPYRPHNRRSDTDSRQDSRDVDVFVTASNEEEARERVVRVATQLLNNMATANALYADDYINEQIDQELGKQEKLSAKAGQPIASRAVREAALRLRGLRIVRTANAITLWGGYPLRNVQIIVVMYKSMH